MLTPRDVMIVCFTTVIGLWSVSTIAIGFIQRMAVCQEKGADGSYVLQRVEPQPGDDERMRKIVANHNRILELECGR